MFLTLLFISNICQFNHGLLDHKFKLVFKFLAESMVKTFNLLVCPFLHTCHTQIVCLSHDHQTCPTSVVKHLLHQPPPMNVPTPVHKQGICMLNIRGLKHIILTVYSFYTLSIMGLLLLTTVLKLLHFSNWLFQNSRKINLGLWSQSDTQKITFSIHHETVLNAKK
jgi:hypothetical protein